MTNKTDIQGIFNHVAISVPGELLKETGRKELLAFYGTVFDWTEMPTMTRDGELLVLRAYTNEQFVFLSADADPMRCPALDHFGMSVPEPAMLDTLLSRAQEFASKDERVEIAPKQTEDYQVLKLHNFYVRYQLPLMIEVQCYEWAQGFDAASLPSD